MYGLDDNTSDRTSKIYDEGWRKEGLKCPIFHSPPFIFSAARRLAEADVLPRICPAHLPAARQAPISLSACVHAQAGMS